MTRRDMPHECMPPSRAVPCPLGCPKRPGVCRYGPPVPRPLGALVAACAVALGLGAAGCSGAQGLATGGCAPVHQDVLDIRSTLHLLPGAPEPPYATDPPTSGAHRVGYYPRGVVAIPIARPTQVALLESGFVVVQYQSSLGVDALAALRPLTTASPYVTLAPNPSLPRPVVATSWVHDLRCAGVGPSAMAALRTFVTQRVGRGPQPTIPLAATSPGGITTTTAPAP